MPVTPKPKKNVDALIAKGGSVGPSNGDGLGPEIAVKLRVPQVTLARIDAMVAARAQRQPHYPRHAWLLEAIYQQLERDSADPLLRAMQDRLRTGFTKEGSHER